MRTFLLSIILIIASTFTSWGQFEEAMPSEENQLLIDKLMEVSHYESYFVEYCTDKIIQTAIEKGWDTKETALRKETINFNDFKKYTLYNAFADVSTEQLKESITLFEELNKDLKHSHFFPTNSMIQSNLELFVKSFYLN